MGIPRIQHTLRDARNYTWEEVIGLMYEVTQTELPILTSISYAKKVRALKSLLNKEDKVQDLWLGYFPTQRYNQIILMETPVTFEVFLDKPTAKYTIKEKGTGATIFENDKFDFNELSKLKIPMARVEQILYFLTYNNKQ